MTGPEDPHEPEAHREGLHGLDLRKLMAEGFVPGVSGSDDVPLPELDGYQILQRVGRGGMGNVFLGRQLSLDRLVAIKMIAGATAVARGFLDRLEREAKTMALLSHPNLVQVYDFVRIDEDDAAIVMEWVPGGNLRDARMKEGEPLPLDETAAIIRSVLGALGAAHRAGIIHRDIKPENILVAADGTVKVSDLGIAVPAGENERFTASGTYSGTPGYAAPEQIAGKCPDARSDIYAVGVLTYELMVGTRPIGNFDPPHKIDSRIPPALGSAVMRCLRPKPDDRPASAGELHAMLFDRNDPTRRNIVAASLSTAMVAGLAGAGILWSRRSIEPELRLPEVSGEAKPDPERILSGHVHRAQDGSYETNGEIAIHSIHAARPLIGSNLHVSFTRLSSDYSIAVFLKLPMGTCTNELAAWEGIWGGVQEVDGVDLRANPNAFEQTIITGRRYEWEMQIREDRITTFLDSEWMQEQEIAGRTLAPVRPWNWNDLDTAGVHLAIASYSSPTLFHSVELSPA